MSKAPTIKTYNFTLKAVDLLNDKQDIIKNINHKEILYKLTLDYPYTEKQWDDFVKWHEAMWSGENHSTNWMIYVDEECVGSITIMRSNKQVSKHIGTIGYWLAKKYWGKGIMTQALNLIIDYAFNELKLHKLKLSFQHDNIGSQRVAEKCGFKFEGNFKEERIRDGELKDLVWYGLSKDYKIKSH